MVDWIVFVPAAIVLSLIPGPNQIVSLRNAIRFGTGPATIALAGRFGVFAVMAGAVAVGLGVILTGSAMVFGVVKWIGVAYLIYVGLSLLWGSRHSMRDNGSDEDLSALRARSRTWRATRQEVVVAATNPKAMLLFAAFLPHFLPATSAGGFPLLLLAGAYIGIEAVSAVGYTVLGGLLGHLDLTARAHRYIDRTSGAAFVGLGGYLATAQRPS
ncbi:LysE family translocator [Nocardia sp. BMG51109]|uniref:LysE family translocator n=1 Tax=Nocardia sp. BMG51109 TaxID=1056816 RepID=UPI0004B0F3C2|nr:LysE family translocator [Nocardia sp. BMG51109]